MYSEGRHVAEYFILGLLFFRAFRGNDPQGWRLRWAVCAVIGVVFYALGDEFHQSWIASRTSSLVDVGIDSMGGRFFTDCDVRQSKNIQTCFPPINRIRITPGKPDSAAVF
jgi:hypothetical protein